MKSWIGDTEKYPNINGGHQYALDVLDGKVLANVYIIAACQRYLDFLDRSEDKEDHIYFLPDKAERYLRLVQKFKHVVGKWSDPFIRYEPWQKFTFMNIMGFYSHKTKNRLCRTAHIEVARGNAKSTCAAQCALFFLALDNASGNHVSCIATKKEQARIVLDSARAMAKGSTEFLERFEVEVLAHKVIQDSTNSTLVALSSDANSLDGRFDALSIIDEVHQVSASLFEVIESGLAKRQDSLLLCITTAGHTTHGIGKSQSDYAKKVTQGEVLDDTFFALPYTLDIGDDIFDERNWGKANPNLGISVDIEKLRSIAIKAKNSPRDVANFKVKNLNMWISESQAFLDQAKWDECAVPSLKIEDYYGKKAFVGMDLASKIDLTCIVPVFRTAKEVDGEEVHFYDVFDYTYIPEETVRNSRNALYENAQGTGHLIVTPGEAINYPLLQKDNVALSNKIKIIQQFYDNWNAVEYAQRMTKEGIEMVEFRMNTANLSEPLKKLDALIREKRIRHNGSPITRWCIGNVVAKEDAAQNIYPRKSHERLKIDFVIALLQGLAGWLQEEQQESAYESRGLRIL